MTSYQGNGSNVAATTVTTANKLAAATGGTETSNTIALITSTTGWIIIRSQGTGTNQAGAGSEPTITDANNFGWIQDDATFDNQTFFTGNWTPAIMLKTNIGSLTADIHCLILNRPNGGGTYGVIGDLNKSGQTINTVKTLFQFSASSLASSAFNIGDRLCLVFIVNITVGSATTNLLTVYMSTSASNGVAGDAEIVSPGFGPTQVVAPAGGGGYVVPGAVITPNIQQGNVYFRSPSKMAPVVGRRLAKPLGGRGLAGKHPFKRGWFS